MAPSGQADDVDRGRVVVVPVPVGAVPAAAAGAAEQSLLGHEDLAPDLEVGVRSAGVATARQVSEPCAGLGPGRRRPAG